MRILIGIISLAFVGSALANSVTISADHAGGNVIELENDGSTIRLKPDLRGGRDWFYWNFDAAAAEPGEVEFVFEGKLRIGVRGPAVSLDDGKNWKWLGTESVRFSTPDDPTESFRFEFTKNTQKARFAVAIPYLAEDLDAFVAKHRENPNLTTSQLTKTRGGKPVELLQVGEPGDGREAVIVTARHHACESMASYVLEGFLAEAMSDSRFGAAFREGFVLYAVPMMDKDGVQAGDQGKWRFPHDHNRDYGTKSIYPEVQAVMKLAKEVNVRHGIDFHCPSLRGEVHEVFYFIGVGLPHIRARTDELRGWIGEEQPQTVRSRPHNFLREPPEQVPAELERTKFSAWFAYLDGVKFAATFEIPYTQRNCPLDAGLARLYGQATLRAWTRGDHSELAAFRKEFGAEYKSKPAAAEAKALRLLDDPELQIEAKNSLGLLRLRQRKYAEAIEYFDSVQADESATAVQFQTAEAQRAIAICRNLESAQDEVIAAINRFERIPFSSPTVRFEVYGAAYDVFDKAGDEIRALDFAALQLPNASKYQRGATLNRMANWQEKVDGPEKAHASRRLAVEHLRKELDPVPVGIFGALMGRDLFEALQGLPEATIAEKRAAADIVFNHKVASQKMKDEIRAALKNEEK